MAISLIAAFAAPGRSVLNTALWFEPPSHCRSGNLPATERPSQIFHDSGLLMSASANPSFYAISLRMAYPEVCESALLSLFQRLL